MRVVLKVTIDAAEDMGLDSAEAIQEQVEEALRDSGMDNAASIEVEVVEEEP
jgi:hypothetical protein